MPLREVLQEPLQEALREPLQDALQERQREARQLAYLVGLADEPVPAVTHDRALGNIRVRGFFLDQCLAEACAFAVLRGRSINVYLPVGAMVVGLQPIEGARALHLKWRQSGVPPELPGRGWLLFDDGVASAPGCWKPEGAGRQWSEEPFLERIQRQRAAAGLGPAVQNGGGR